MLTSMSEDGAGGGPGRVRELELNLEAVPALEPAHDGGGRGCLSDTPNHQLALRFVMKSQKRLKTWDTAWALSLGAVSIFFVCSIVEIVSPSTVFCREWVELFTTAPKGSPIRWIEEMLANTVAGWVAALVFVPIYNWIHERN